MTGNFCHSCGIVHDLDERLPRGWKRFGDRVLCRQCAKEEFSLIAVTIPVAEPLSGTWDDLRAGLKELWTQTTRCSNWMMTELYARDVRRKGDEKIPPMPKIYLYPEARRLFRALPPQSVSSIEQSVKMTYRAKRWEILWTRAGSLPSFRYPTPFPVHNQSWKCWIEAERPVVSIRLRDDWFNFRLRGGHDFRRQLAAFREMANGSAKRCALELYKDHKGVILCKMVTYRPKHALASDASGTLQVMSGADVLLVAVNEKDVRLWTYSADHVRRWMAQIQNHSRQLRRWSEDSKFERRPAVPFAERRRLACEKQRRRIDSACHQISAELVGYAKRRKFAEIRCDFSEQTYCKTFPWFRLGELIKYKAEVEGLKVTITNGQAQESQAA